MCIVQYSKTVITEIKRKIVKNVNSTSSGRNFEEAGFFKFSFYQCKCVYLYIGSEGRIVFKDPATGKLCGSGDTGAQALTLMHRLAKQKFKLVFNLVFLSVSEI
jgi:hypothetical protein